MLFYSGQCGPIQQAHGITFQRLFTCVTFTIQLHDSTIPGPGTDPRKPVVFDLKHVFRRSALASSATVSVYPAPQTGPWREISASETESPSSSFDRRSAPEIVPINKTA